ncbi:hypothetical protein QA802_09410 [Streptomyces sp. B21-105]|uniref:DUF6907 domain-containing protein n=1 Tax=Streptomyces sp. B21-105 TaxID=3039417 RepID=UPI002FEF81B7
MSNEDERARQFVDRHFPAVARFLAEPRTIALDTVDHGRVELDEPAWCVGHGLEMGRPVYRHDLTHNSVRVKAGAVTEAHGWVPMLNARISWAPFLELVPVVTLELSVQHDFPAEDVAHVVQGLADCIKRLEQVAAEAIRLRGEVL